MAKLIARNGVKTPVITGIQGRIETASKECGNTLRGLTVQIDSTDWRATVNGTRFCSTPDCGSACMARGLCVRHHFQWRRATPKELRSHTRMTQSPEERFHAKYERGGVDSCWEWQGARKPSGHGNFAFTQQKFAVASNYALELATGSRPDGAFALHRCDNPPCVNPSHLYWGDYQDNMNDQLARGRRPRGEDHARSIRTEAQIIEIRERYAAGESAKELEAEFGIALNGVYHIARGITWAHIGGPITIRRAKRAEIKE